MYIFLFIFSTLLAFLYVNFKYTGIVYYTIILILSIFAGSRSYNVSFDYETYQSIFDIAINENYSNYILQTAGTELCAFVLPQISHLLFQVDESANNFTFVIFAFLGVITKLSALRKSEFFFLGFMLYISNLFWGQEMITIRAGVASGIFLLSIQDIVDKQNKRFFIKMIFAFIFHTSSVLFVFCWAIIRYKVTLKKMLWGLFISIIIAVLKINLLSLLYLNTVFPKIQIYLDSQDLAGGDKVNVFNFMAMFSMLIIFFFLSIMKRFKDNVLFDTLFKIHILSLIIFFAFSPVNMVFSLRSFELLSVIQLLLYPMIVIVFPTKLKVIGYTTIIAFSIIQFYYFIYYSNLFNNYSSWLF